MSVQILKLCVILVLVAVYPSLEIVQQNSITYEQNFIQDIWHEVTVATDIEARVINTTFIQGVKNGTLDPLCFGKYIIQDIAYLQVSAGLWDQACQMGQKDPQFYSECLGFRDGEKNFENYLKTEMYLSKAKPMKQMKNYINYKSQTFKANGYHYILIVNYVCYKLYQSVTSKIIKQAKRDNPYYGWIEANANSPAAQKIQRTLNMYQSFFNKDQVKNDVQNFLVHELNVFAACCETNNYRSLFAH